MNHAQLSSPSTEGVAAVLRVQGRTKKWLSEQLGCSRVTLYARLREGFTEEEQEQLVRILGVPHAMLFLVPQSMREEYEVAGSKYLEGHSDVRRG